MIGAALFAIALVAASDNCPWLNTATAEGLLGIPVQVTVLHAAGDTTCAFSGQGVASKTSLQIEVTIGHSLETTECSSAPIAMKTIGNEAQACAIKGGDKQVIEGVFGRVRDQLFRIEIATSDIHASRVKLREAARAAALHVAGNLF